MFVKFCGFKRVEDAEFAFELGVGALGLVFEKTSPRAVTIKEALNISKLNRRKTLLTGVFVNESQEEILKIAEKVSLDAIQLHGEEKPEDYVKLINRGIKIIKAIRVGSKKSERLYSLWKEIADFILLDRYIQGIYGGTGERFDWSLIGNFLKHETPVLVAGGINPENVKEVIKILGISGIDVSSGIEDSPGIKNRAKMQEIIETLTANTQKH